MSTLAEVKSWIAEQLPALIAKYDVPAAAVGVRVAGEIIAAAARGRREPTDRPTLVP